LLSLGIDPLNAHACSRLHEDIIMLWIKIVHLLIAICFGFLIGLIFSRFSRGNWRRIDTIFSIGVLAGLMGLIYVIISQDF
jgi:hypothetical protein